MSPLSSSFLVCHVELMGESSCLFWCVCCSKMLWSNWHNSTVWNLMAMMDVVFMGVN